MFFFPLAPACGRQGFNGFHRCNFGSFHSQICTSFSIENLTQTRNACPLWLGAGGKADANLSYISEDFFKDFFVTGCNEIVVAFDLVSLG